MKQRKWWQEAIGYEIYPRSFCDSNNDGVGDLPGIISKLDYLEKLGVNLLWICPFFKSPMDDNGYDVSDYLTVDPVFGTNEDFQTLLSKAHAKGIHVIIDFVLNHTSDEHPWFLEARSSKNSPKRDFYLWQDGKLDAKGQRRPPNNWQGFFEDSAWNYDAVAGQYYLKIFSKKMPDLNWENPQLRKHIFEVAKHWLDQGVDGFRLDAIAHLAKDLTFSDSTQDVGPTGMTLDFRKFSSIPRLFDYLAEFKRDVLANPEKDYYATGAWAGWANTTAKMTAVARGDEAVASIKDQLDDAEFLYVFEGMVLTDTETWSMAPYLIDGVETVFNGGQTVKIIRTALDDTDTIDYWIQSRESGAVTNLTPETLWIPNYVETAVEGTPGHWNENLAAYEPGTYTMVYAYIAAVGEVAAHHAMGLIATTAAA